MEPLPQPQKPCHSTPAHLEKLARGQLSPRQSLDVCRHLLECVECQDHLTRTFSRGQEVLRRFLSQEDALRLALWPDPLHPRHFVSNASDPGPAASLSSHLTHFLQRLVDPRLLDTVDAVLPAAIEIRSWGLVELLLKLCWDAWPEDPCHAEGLSELALGVAQQLEPDDYGEAFLKDLQARAWSFIANSRRLRSDLKGAEKALRIVETLLRQGSGCPVERAEPLYLKAVLLKDQSRFDESRAAFDQAIAIYRWSGNKLRHSQALLSQANMLYAAGEPEAGIEVLHEATRVAEGEVEPRLVLGIKQHLAAYLTEIGSAFEARKLMPTIQALAERYANQMDKARIGWLEGLIAAKLGETGKAEESLRAVRQIFLEKEIGFDAAVVSLELAALYLEEGRLQETRRLAEEMLPIFRALDVSREAFSALVLFQRAVNLETATVQMARDIAAFLRRSSTRPGLRSERPS